MGASIGNVTLMDAAIMILTPELLVADLCRIPWQLTASDHQRSLPLPHTTNPTCGELEGRCALNYGNISRGTEAECGSWRVSSKVLVY